MQSSLRVFLASIGLTALAATSAPAQQRVRETGSVHAAQHVLWVRATDAGIIQLFVARGFRDAFARPHELAAAGLARWSDSLRRLHAPADGSELVVRSDSLGASDVSLERHLGGDLAGLRVDAGDESVRLPEASALDLITALDSAVRVTRELTAPPRVAQAPPAAPPPAPPPPTTVASAAPASPERVTSGGHSPPAQPTPTPAAPPPTPRPMPPPPASPAAPAAPAIPSPAPAPALASKAAQSGVNGSRADTTAKSAKPDVRDRRPAPPPAAVTLAAAAPPPSTDAVVAGSTPAPKIAPIAPPSAAATTAAPAPAPAAIPPSAPTPTPPPASKQPPVPPAPPPTPPSTPQASGRDSTDLHVRTPLGQFVVPAALRSNHRAAVQYCYKELGLKYDASLAGRVTVLVTLAPDGSVKETSVVQRSWQGVTAGEVEACLRAVIGEWHFEADDRSVKNGGTLVDFDFSPTATDH